MTSWEPYTSEEWPPNRQATEGLEFDWFCLDQSGQLGVFSTAGSGPVPELVFRSGVKIYNALLAFLPARELSGATLVFKGGGNYRDWERYARHGLFAFDFEDVHRTWAEKRNGYDLIYRPTQPVMVSDLPEELRAGLPMVQADFGNGDLIPMALLKSL